MSATVARMTVVPRSMQTPVWGSFVSSATPPAVPCDRGTLSGHTEAVERQRASRARPPNDVGDGPEGLPSRQRGPGITIQIP